MNKNKHAMHYENNEKANTFCEIENNKKQEHE